MTHKLSSARPLFLSTLPAGNKQIFLAYLVVGISTLFFIGIAPFAKLPLIAIPAFIPIYESILIIGDLITAILLINQFSILRTRALLILASGYLFTAVIACMHMLTFPGLFSTSGLLSAGPQSTAWLYMIWHGGFPIFIIAYALLSRPSVPNKRLAPSAIGNAIFGGIVAVSIIIYASVLLVTKGHQFLPTIMAGNHYSTAMIVVVSTVWLLSFIALLLLCQSRSRLVLDIWLKVVMCAWMFDIALSAVVNAGRFDLGFYAGRIYGLLAASFVLMVLLLENSALYARLVRTYQDERRRTLALKHLSTQLVAANKDLAAAKTLAESANHAKSIFLSSMSHELRTPLNVILGYAQLLALKSTPATLPRTQEFANYILKAGNHLLALISEILDLAKIESGALTLSLEKINLESIVNECQTMTKPLAEERKLVMSFLPIDSLYVIADPTRLKQILFNLISNAIKYNREQGTVIVSCERIHSSHIRISVQDTGLGLTQEQIGSLFQAFNRLGQEAGKEEGSGVGLVVTKHLIELMGGKIGVSSTVNIGSTFWIELPEASLS